MSFASETKKELTNLEVKDCCINAELSALIRMNGAYHLQTAISYSMFKPKTRRLPAASIHC